MLSIVPERSRVVLIGSSHFPEDPDNLPALPAVKANVDDLEQLLSDTTVVGIPLVNIIKILDEDVPSRIAERLAQVAREAFDTLIVYYAGHGLIGRSSELFLATSGSTQDDADYNALDFQTVRKAVSESPATKKILIIDCCFSGRAISIMSDNTSLLRAELDIKGTYALASAPANKPAMAPDGARYTAFTGELVRILDEGLNNNRDYITLEEIYDELKRELYSARLPEPQRTNVQDLDDLRIAHNRWRQPSIEDRMATIEARLNEQERGISEALQATRQRLEAHAEVGNDDAEPRSFNYRAMVVRRYVDPLVWITLAFGPSYLYYLARYQASGYYANKFSPLLAGGILVVILTQLVMIAFRPVMNLARSRLFSALFGSIVSPRAVFLGAIVGLLVLLTTGLFLYPPP